MKKFIPLLGFIFSFTMFFYYSYKSYLTFTVIHGVCSILNILAFIYIVRNPINHKE